MASVEAKKQVDSVSAEEELSMIPHTVATDPRGHQGLLERLQCHGLRALSNTSAHGFNRLAVSGNWLARAVWIAVIAGAVSMFTFHVYTLVARYQSKPTSVRYMPNHAPFETPDIYVCPMKPISEMKLLLRNITDIEERNRTERIINDLTKLSKNNRWESWQYITNSIDVREFREAACLSAWEMFLDEGMTTPRIIFHPVYTCCAVISADDDFFNTKADTVDVDIFADNSDYPEFEADYLDIARRTGRGNGVRIFIVPKKHYPGRYSTSVIVSPGFTTHIVLTQTTLINHPQKHLCTEKSELVPMIDPYTMESNDYFYTPEMCRERKRSGREIKSFNCFFSSDYNYMEEFQNYSLCDNFTIRNETEVATLVGTFDIHNEDWRQIRSSCQKYKHCISTFYEAKLFAYRMKNTTQVFGDVKRYWPVADWHFKKQNASTSTKMIMNSFLNNYMEIRLSIAQEGATYIIEDLSYPLANLFSDIGGILGLYIGVSVLTLFELVEILVTMAGIVCHAGYRNRRTTQ